VARTFKIYGLKGENVMKDINKREKVFIVIIISLVVCLVVEFATLNNTKKECDSLAFQNCSLEEVCNDKDAANLKLLEALRREHKIALAVDTKLLVANLAWLDRENDTFYVSAFIDPNSKEGNRYKLLKKLFDEDKEARTRAIDIVCYYLDNTQLYEITNDYYNQIATDEG
jgi:hypothetical protein